MYPSYERSEHHDPRLDMNYLKLLYILLTNKKNTSNTTSYDCIRKDVTRIEINKCFARIPMRNLK